MLQAAQSQPENLSFRLRRLGSCPTFMCIIHVLQKTWAIIIRLLIATIGEVVGSISDHDLAIPHFLLADLLYLVKIRDIGAQAMSEIWGGREICVYA
jgi:hypothetical protein